MQMLAQLLSRPEQGALLPRLALSLGKGLHEYLLQQVDWVLQDMDSLLGNHSLNAVLHKRFGSLLAATSKVSFCTPPSSLPCFLVARPVCLQLIRCLRPVNNHSRSYTHEERGLGDHAPSWLSPQS